MFVSNTANAEKLFEIEKINQCQKRHSDRIDYSRCLDQVLSSFERDMQAWQKDIEFKLTEASKGTGRTDSVIVFKSSHKKFMDYRNKHCQWQYLAMLPDVASASIMTKECRILMTVQRINNLKEISAFDF